MAISKYTLHRGEHSKKSDTEIAYDIMSIVENFTSVQNNFQELFTHIYQDLRKFLFMTSNREIAQKYELEDGELYKKVIEKIDSKVNKRVKEVLEQLSELTNAKEEAEFQLSRQMTIFAQKQKKYLAEIEWFKKISNDEFVKYLEEQLNEKKDRIQELEDSQSALVRLRDQIEKENQKQQDQIQNQVKQIARLNTALHDLRLGRVESEKLLIKLRDRFDQLNLIMTGMKHAIQDVQRQNEELKTERTVLVKRAAVSFEEMTPRPKYQKMINFNEHEQKKTLKSTGELTEILLQKIGNEVFKHDFRSKLFDERLSSKIQPHPKLVQAEQTRINTISSILQSKEELREVKNLLVDSEDQI